MKADINKLAYIGSKPKSGKSIKRDSDSWFTPTIYTELAREVMGGIDLDPFSSASANKHVKAKRFFDKKKDAFEQKWFKTHGCVFMNPPYGRTIIDKSVDIFLANIATEAISQGIVLVNNATETRWFQSLLRSSSSLCLPDRRIAFENDDGKHMSGNTRGQVFFYFGRNIKKFNKVFSSIGIILIPNN